MRPRCRCRRTVVRRMRFSDICRPRGDAKALHKVVAAAGMQPGEFCVAFRTYCRRDTTYLLPRGVACTVWQRNKGRRWGHMWSKCMRYTKYIVRSAYCLSFAGRSERTGRNACGLIGNWSNKQCTEHVKRRGAGTGRITTYRAQQ